jgi:hypothetical protein
MQRVTSTKKFGFNSRQLVLWYSEAGNAILKAQSLSEYPAKVFRRNNPRLWTGRVWTNQRGMDRAANNLIALMDINLRDFTFASIYVSYKRGPIQSHWRKGGKWVRPEGRQV